ncbi:hypothetical protein GX408_12110 [bacterium]|nr:hypothetical protein [bacterium]
MSEKPGRPKIVSFWLLPTFCLALVDQLTKAFVRSTQLPDCRIPIVDDLLFITFIPNYRGFSWFVPDLPQWAAVSFFFLRILLLLLAFPLFSFYREQGFAGCWSRIALLGLSGGILGNLLDGLFTPYTTDFIQIGHSPSANLADLFAFIGLVALAAEGFGRWRRSGFNRPGLEALWKQSCERKRAFGAFLKSYVFQDKSRQE